MNEITMIPIERLYSHPDNPRKELGDLTELADSIKANGILQNLVGDIHKRGGSCLSLFHGQSGTIVSSLFFRSRGQLL